MVLFGGFDNNDDYLNDVWVLSTANGQGGTPAWSQIYPTPDLTQTTNGYGGLPPTRYVHSAVYDNTNNRMIIFGGLDNNGDSLNDVWVLSNADKLFAPEAEFYGTPTSGIGPLPVSFVDTSLNNPTSWNWNFGDGITTGFTLSSTTTHIYGTAAVSTTYTVQLIVSNQYGTSTSTQANYISVTEPGPNALFSGTPLSGYGPLTVYFSDSSYDLYGSSTAWAWDFGDGSTSNIQNPIHVYGTVSASTAYTVELVVTTNFGTSTSTQADYISVTEPEPSASFSGTPLSGYGPLTVYFSDSSYNLYGDSTAWAWDFGDGSTSDMQNPIYVYGSVSASTAYTVELIVTTDFGTSTAIRINYIQVNSQPAVEDWKLYSTELDNSPIYLRRD